ncbi:MAG: hypothetical protein WC372_04245 [Candidatus Neomarinimicrobiota bacterium]|jgi:hypothetical protein|nr:hypothetical protein [Candidatus Neomarinimicrobiota bacterium]MDD3966409.1 hypothetical protein [Candidatus Neomarinimicrobiota bacterium]MDX9780019.1 hypothetical protein [bacterium]
MLKKIIFLMVIGSLVFLWAKDPNYYIRRANLNYKQVDDMIVTLRIRSRLPEATVPDRETELHFIRPDSLFTEDNEPLMLPREIFLMDLERLVKDARSLRLIEVEEAKNHSVFLEVIKAVEERDVIFLTMIDTLSWLLTQMKMIDKPEMIADISFTHEELFPGIFLPTDIRVMIETKQSEKKKVPNPRSGIPVSSSFGYIDMRFSNYRINMLHPSLTEPGMPQ